MDVRAAKVKMAGNIDRKRGAASPPSDNEDSLDEAEDEMVYYEEASESEPELECELWDHDCKLVGRTPAARSIVGCHLMATCASDPIAQNKRVKLQPSLQAELTEPPFVEELRRIWNRNSPISYKNLEVITSPFKVCVVRRLLENEALLDDIRRQLYETNFNVRNMDLYEFFQSKDLKHLISIDSIKAVYDFLETDLMKWIASITGYDLTHTSATCSLYSHTDYLLVHDDQREDRRVAFILYLTDEWGWETKDGGALQLLSRDVDGQPLDVVREILPENNQLVFFPVANNSYHQVAEVTSLNKYRLSINGWFHTKAPPVLNAPLYKPLPNSLYSHDCHHSKLVDIDLATWVKEDYLNSKTIKLIQSYVEENSEISLKEFFRKESFAAVSDSLKSHDLKWVKVSPVNRYCYEIADLSTLPHTLERLLSLVQSNQMFRLLQRYTDLELASIKFELQRWTPGSYALLTDYDWKEKNELDLIMYFGCKDAKRVIGARTQYVTIEDEVQNALITIDPEENNLNIIYRDSARFTKYFSKQSRCQCFYVLICSYSE